MYVIIAGCNKAGTTSLFRYLADHPQVSPSRKKETDYFLADIGDDIEQARARYEALFTPRNGASCRLEASPGYLRNGRAVAERIARTVPSATLLFILREPASRLISYLRTTRQRLDEVVTAVDPESYVELVERVAAGEQVPPEPGPMRNALRQFQGGCYAHYLREFLECFQRDRIHILFFEDLSADERRFMRGVCQLLGIDDSYYAHYRFTVENRTGDHRLRKLHRAMWRLNQVLEPFLNRSPGARKALRSVYRVINQRSSGSDSDKHFDEGLTQRLRAVYAAPNDSLRTLLAERYPQLPLPDWLRTTPPHARID